MLRIRIAVAAAALLFSGFLAASASAQTATAQPVGKPLQLLKIIEQPSHPKAKPHAKLAHKAPARRRIRIAARKKPHKHIVTAGRNRPLMTVRAVDTPAPEASGPAANPAVAEDVAAAAPLPEPEPVAAPAAQDPSQVVIAGQTVKVTSPDSVNEIDLAANDVATPTSDAAPIGAMSAPAMRKVAEPQRKSGYKATVEGPKRAPVGSASWILQVMAALGGAVTAGSVAWFLIGGAPQRTYG